MEFDTTVYTTTILYKCTVMAPIIVLCSAIAATAANTTITTTIFRLCLTCH